MNSSDEQKGSLRQELAALRQRVDELEQKTAFQASLLNAAGQAIIATNLKGEITFFSRFAEELYGWAAKDVLGRNIVEITVPQVSQQQAQEIMQALGKGESWSGEFLVQRKDGATFPALVFDSPIHDQSGNLVGVVGISKDISDRKRAEKELRLSQELFSNAFHVGPVGMTITRIADGKFIDANESFCQLFELAQHEVIGHTSTELNMWTPAERARLIQKQRESGGLHNFEFVARSKSGKPISLLFSSKEMSIGENHCHLTTMIDITERKQVEKSLLESEHRYRALFASMPVGFVVFEVVQDENGVPIDLVIVAANSGFDSTTGLNTQEVIGQRLTHVLPGIEDDEADWIGTYGKIALTGEPRHFEQGSERLGYYYSITAYQPDPRQCAVMFVDITERKRTEEALRQSEERLRLTTESADVAVWEYDFEINAMSRSANHDTLYGLESQETWVVETFLNATHPDDREMSNRILQASLAPGGPDDYSFDFRVVWPDESVHWLSVVGRVFERDTTGQAQLVRGCLIDITERKRAEDALRKSEKIHQKLADRLSLLLHLAEDISADFDIDTLLPETIDRLGAIFPNADLRLFYIYSPQDQELVAKAWHGYDNQAASQLRLQPGEAISGQVFQEGRSFLARTPEESKQKRGPNTPDSPLFTKAIGGQTVLSSMCVPLRLPTGQVVGTLSLGSMQSVFAEEDLALLEGVARQIAQAMGTAQLIEDLRYSREQFRRLVRHRESVREEERKRLSQNVHDNLGQALSGLKMDLGWLTRHMAESPALHEKIRSMSALIDTTIRSVQEISADLRPGMLDDFGLGPTLAWQAKRFQQRTDIQCEYTSNPEDIVLDADRSTVLFRVFQELLTNIYRHAEATQVNIHLQQRDDSVQLVVEDNGQGIDETEAMAFNSLGLLGIRERVQFWGGTVFFRGVLGEGTRVEVVLPINTEGGG